MGETCQLTIGRVADVGKNEQNNGQKIEPKVLRIAKDATTDAKEDARDGDLVGGPAETASKKRHAEAHGTIEPQVDGFFDIGMLEACPILYLVRFGHLTLFFPMFW